MIAVLRGLVKEDPATPPGISLEDIHVLKFQYGNARLSGRAYFATFVPGRTRPTHMAKLSRQPEDRLRFRREEERLRAVHERSPELAASLPRPAGVVERGIKTLTVQTFVRGTPLWSLAGDARDLGRFETAFHAAGDWLRRYRQGCPVVGTTTGTRLAEWAKELGKLAADRSPDRAGTLERKVGALAPRLAALAELPIREQHGDFGPVNILLHEDGISVIDWEDSGDHPLPGFDSLNFLDQASLVVAARSPSTSGQWFPAWRDAQETTLSEEMKISREALAALRSLERLFNVVRSGTRHGADSPNTRLQMDLFLAE